MKINFRAKNFNLTQGGKEGIEKKLNALSDLFNEDTMFDIFITKREKDFKCELKVQKGKDFIRCEESGKTFEFAIDNTLNALKKRVRKIKSMKITKKRGNNALALKESIRNMDIEDDVEDSIDLGIKRYKSISVESLSEEDAVMLLEALNHSFFVFLNKDRSNSVCILYRRSEGYGLLETDID